VSHFYSLVELCEDYETKVRTNPLTFICYFIQWRYSGGGGGTDGPARRADTPQALLFEFVNFVDSRRWPSARRSHKDDEDTVAAALAQAEEEATAAGAAAAAGAEPAGAEGAGAKDRAQLKQRLRRAVQARAEESVEAQKVQVLATLLVQPAGRAGRAGSRAV
jgi:hypothetical protein